MTCVSKTGKQAIKAHVNNHLITSHLLPSLMGELTAFQMEATLELV